MNKSANFEINQTSFANLGDYVQGLKSEHGISTVLPVNEGLTYNIADDKLVQFVEGNNGFLVNSTTNKTFTG